MKMQYNVENECFDGQFVIATKDKGLISSTDFTNIFLDSCIFKFFFGVQTCYEFFHVPNKLII
jgi:hypothetical protein